jgi:hypothetical protein
MRKGFLKYIVTLVIVMTLFAAGSSYAKWSRDQKVSAKLSTDTFKFGFGEEGYTSEIVDESNTSYQGFELKAELENNDNSAVITFNSGVPLQPLIEGKYIKISYPIKNKSNKPPMDIYAYDVDFTKKDKKTLELEPLKTYLSLGETVYEYENAPKEFKEKIKFDVFRSITKENDDYIGHIYLGLTDESKEKVLTFPKELKLEDKIEDLSIVSDLSSEQEGIMVTYKGELDLYLEQSNKSNENK